MSDPLNFTRLHELAIEARREMKISHVCMAALSIATRERLTPDQEDQFIAYLSDDMGLVFDDELIEKCREDFAEGQALSLIHI